MPLDLVQFGSKLNRYRTQLQLSLAEVKAGTGIDETRLLAMENGQVAPTGDEVLILADFLKCDYRFLVSNEKLAAFEQTENLYRRFGEEFSKQDRWRVQEFLFLCENEHFLEGLLGKVIHQFHFRPNGDYFKGHGADAARALRKHLGCDLLSVPVDVYSDFRKLGIHLFRRRLQNSNISGLTLRHPQIGNCVLVNYSEDIYRQRFTAAHEVGHVILDGDEVTVSGAWNRTDLVEIRANTFASRYLLPPELLRKLPVPKWNKESVVEFALKLKVSAIALLIGLKESNVISDETYHGLVKAKVGSESKVDPELHGVTGNSIRRKTTLLERGLSTYYVSLCFRALETGLVSKARVADMLLTSESDLSDLATLFRVNLEAQDARSI